MVDDHAKPFIGKFVTITNAKNQSYKHLNGYIIDETKNAFVIQTNNVEKTVLKSGCVFDIEGKQIDGEKIIKRLEDRIKSRR